MDELPARPHRGRGAVSNPAGRYEKESRHAVDDGWGESDDDLAPLRTVVTEERVSSVVSRNTSPDLPFNRSVNPYRGCEHGCIYCYARPSHAWMGLSPGLDFETRLFAKPEAPEILEKELRNPRYRPETILIGANTDPYQPLERHRGITRRLVEVMAAFNHPLAIGTKSNLVLRDLDILAPMAERNLVSVGYSVTTLDRALARQLEPRAPTPERRLDAIARLSAAGIPVTLLVSPIIPFLTDAEMERILEAGAAAGARAANFTLLRLPRELTGLFAEWLETHAPGKAKHVLNQLRESRAGGLNDPRFGIRMRGTGTHAELLAERFRLARKRLGLRGPQAVGYGLDTTLFRPPPRVGDQGELF